MRDYTTTFGFRRRYGWIRGALNTAGTAVLLAAASPALADHALGSSESVEVSDLYVFAANPTTKVTGAVTLVRDFRNKVVDASLTTSALKPGHAYSIWWAVFNDPWFCSDPCGVDDLPSMNGDPRIKVSVFWGGGLLADESGNGNVTVKLVPGRTDRELFAPAQSKDYGLQTSRLYWAHIHFVLRDHGPAMEGMVAQQVGTATEACFPEGAMPGATPDPANCANVFASMHPPLGD